MVVAPKPAGGEPAPIKPPPPQSPIGPLEAVLGVLLIGLVGFGVLRDRGRPAAAGGVVPVAAAAPSSERLFPFVLLLFVGSGCAALMYEIIWFQGLQLVLGSSAVSIAVLLGTFMAGMCIGSLALARYVGRNRHPLRIYALLEILIAERAICRDHDGRYGAYDAKQRVLRVNMW